PARSAAAAADGRTSPRAAEATPARSRRRCAPWNREWRGRERGAASVDPVPDGDGSGGRRCPPGPGGAPVRTGVRLAVDPGTARIGVARSDPSGILATPVETIRRGPRDLDRIAALVLEYEAREVIVGYPASLSGAEGRAARSARAFARTLARKLAPVPVRLVDERLTTVTAQQQLQTGASYGRRGARGGRAR